MSLLDRLVTPPQRPRCLSISEDTKSLHNIVTSNSLITHHRILHGDSHIVLAGDDPDADGTHAVHLELELTRSGDD